MQNKADPCVPSRKWLLLHFMKTQSSDPEPNHSNPHTQADDPCLCLNGKVNFAGCLCKVPLLRPRSISGAQTAKDPKKKTPLPVPQRT